MKRRFLSICNACVSIAIALVCASSGQMAHATFVEFVQQVGGDVVATGSGSINTAALTPEGTAPNVAILNPGAGLALFGPATGTETDEYSGFTSGSANFGGFSGVVATSGSGDLVGVFGLDALAVPQGYVSGAPLSNTSTWAGQSYASLGLTEGAGTYTWEWGAGPSFDDFIMVLQPVPEPASLSLLGVGSLGALALFAQRRRNQAVVIPKMQ